MLNLGRLVSRAASYWPDRDAVVCGTSRRTFADLDERTNRLASALGRRGAPVGSSIATYAANSGELVEVEIALYKGGFLRVPVNHRLGTMETAHVLADAEVTVLFTDDRNFEGARAAIAASGRAIDLIRIGPGSDAECEEYERFLSGGCSDPVGVDLDPDDPCVLHFTSGSTGKLKAAVQTVGNRLANARKRLMDPTAAVSSRDVYLVSGPITHASGMSILAALSRGTTIVVMPRFDVAEFLRLIEAEGVTSTFVVPTMLNMILADTDGPARDTSSLICLRVGGAPVSPRRLEEAVARFGPVIAQGYGQAETTSGVTVLTTDDVVRGITEDPEILQSCGRALFDTELRIVDENFDAVPAGALGELVVRGPDCVRQYWREPDLSAESFRDGWVLTGDIAYLREDGYLFIVDRKKDMIISGGFNVYSSEVETVLYEHPEVSEVCVVGVPDDTWGEAVKAVVVPKTSGGDAAEFGAELIEFCGHRLDRFKKPRSVDVVDSLPVNRNGKIDRKEIKQRYWAGAARAVN